MKRWMIVVLGLVVVAAAGFAVVYSFVGSTSRWARSLSWPDPDLSSIADGVYEGRAALALPRGTAAANTTATVRVTVKDHRYEAIEVVEPAPISSSMTSFARIVIDQQTLRPDAITGGTVTKAAILIAASNALSRPSLR